MIIHYGEIMPFSAFRTEEKRDINELRVAVMKLEKVLEIWSVFIF